MDDISSGGNGIINTYTGMPIEEREAHESKFQVGQSVKSEVEDWKGVVIKVTPNASAIHTDMYTVRVSDGTRRYVEENLIELDEMVITTKIDDADTEVVIEEALNENDFKPQYAIGSYVQTISDGETIFRITKFLGEIHDKGQPLYEAISDNGEKRLLSETTLKPYSGRQAVRSTFSKKEVHSSENEPNKKAEIQSKTEEILKFLNISNSNVPTTQLENAMKIHKYISQNSAYTSDIMEEKMDYGTGEIYLNELYNGLVNKRGVCTTDSIIFKHLLSEIGMQGEVVILQSNSGEVHAATLVQIGKDAYYFDTTLERTIFTQNSNNPDHFVFCCAGLGQQEYKRYYNPVGILPENMNGNLLPMPSDISQESIPKIIIRNIGNDIEDLTFDENTIYVDLENMDVPINEKDKATGVISSGIRLLRDTESKSMEDEE